MNRISDGESSGGSAGKPLKAATRLVTAGRVPAEQYGFVNTPIYRGSTVLYPDAEKFLRRDAKYTYGTKGTPTTNALETAWTELSGAAGTVLVPSGLAAKPKLLVLVVLEQMRQDYWDAAAAHFVAGGLRRILLKGAHFPDCRHLASSFSASTVATPGRLEAK